MAAGESRDEEGWEIARRGIQMVLNNQYLEAQELFRGHEESIQLAAGHCFVVFMVYLCIYFLFINIIIIQLLYFDNYILFNLQIWSNIFCFLFYFILMYKGK